MMQTLLRLCLVLIALLVLAPAPAQACVGPLQPVCDMITGGDILKAITGRVKAYVDTLLSELDMKHAEARSTASDMNTLKTATAAETAEASRGLSGPSGASCAVTTMGMDYLRGGRRNQGVVDPTQPFGGLGANGRPPAHSDGVQTRAFRTPTPVGPTGRFVPTGKAIADADSGDVPFEPFIKDRTEKMAVVDQARRDNLLKGSTNQLIDAKTQFDFHNNNFADAAQPLFYNADIKVQTILGNDTFPATVNRPKIATQADSAAYTADISEALTRFRTESENVEQGNVPLTLQDAADAYCRNLVEPTILPPNRGPVKANSIDRQGYSNQRTGWDARLSLAKTICDEAVSRRIPKKVNMAEATSAAATTGQTTATATDWFTSTLKEYRALACKSSPGIVSTVVNPVGSAVQANADVTACENQVNELASKNLVSEYEMAKTIYTRMLFTPNASKLIGAANENDTLKMMLQLDQLQVMLNYRIYELQEKLTLIKSAQLATMVEGGRTRPNAETPTGGQ